MATICIACGMPMETPEDHAGGDVQKDYCPHCARSDGSMQSYDEKLAGFSAWLVSTQGIDPAAASAQAATILAGLPAWSAGRT